MARLNHPDLAAWYDVAARWVRAALVEGDSLFTPGARVWTPANLDELYRRFVENADEGEGGFLDKLDGQLAGAASEVRQLMAELLYVYYLPANETPTPKKKREVVRSVLERMSPPVALPDDLAAALERGVARSSQAYQQQRYYQLKFLLDATIAWWAEPADVRERLLADPAALKAFAARVPVKWSQSARYMFLYLVRPDAFEPIMAGKHRTAIAEAFANDDERAIADEDERLRAIRARLTPEHGEGFGFYKADLKSRWQPPEDDEESTGEPSDAVRYWKVAPGAEAKDWDLCRDAGFIYMNGDGFGDLSDLTHGEFVARLEAQAAAEGKTSNVRDTASFAHLTWRFAHEIKDGDVIFANRGFSEVLGIGRVVGDYYYEADGRVGAHRRKVDWFDVEPRRVDQPGWRATLTPVKSDVARSIIDGVPPAKPERESATQVLCEYLARNPDATLDEVRAHAVERKVKIAELTLKNALYHYGRATVQACRRIAATSGQPSSQPTTAPPPGPPPTGDVAKLLLKRKNVVLHGPPGTGKTRQTLAVVDAWRGWQGADSVEQVTFHPSYAYEDFIEGFRPDGEGRFTLRPGLFVEFCRRAAAAPGRQFLLVVDELNRGDVARIFGELITLIEPDKRGVASARLPYSHERFAVPPNVHLLGTMNAADRSVSLLDVAIRRRFSFVELPPDPNVIDASDEHHRAAGDVPLAALMAAINRRLADANVDRDRAIGHSYFLIARGAADDPLDELRERFRHGIVPLVHEYCYANVPQMGDVLCGLVRDGAVDEAVLGDRAKFVAALRAICAPGGAP